MNLSPDLRARLTALGEADDDALDLTEAALMLSALDRPRVETEAYRRHLDAVAEEVRAFAAAARTRPDLRERADILARIIGRKYGYTCPDDVFEDLEAANLTRVIDRRSGLPVVVGLIYFHAAAAQGWPIAGIDFPSRFLVRLEDDGQRLIVDPATGRAMSPADMRALLKAVAGNDAELTPAHYAPMTRRGVLLRLQNNIKLRLLQAGRIADALTIVDAMVLLSPDTPGLWREAGLLNAKLDNLKAAIAAFEEYLRREPGAPERIKADALLRELRARIH